MATLFFKVGADYSEVIRLQQEIKKLETLLKNANFTTSVDALSARLVNARTQLEGLVKNAAIAGQNLQTMANSMRNAAANVNASSSGMATSFGRATEAQRHFLNSLDGTTNGLNKMSGVYNNVSMSLGNFIKNFTLANAALKGVSMVTSAISKAQQTITSFEAANSTLQAISGSTGEEFEALKERALELGSTTMFTASQVTQLETELAKLGFRSGDIINMSGGILNFAQSTGADLADAASTAGAALRMFEAESTETTKIVSAMSAATRMSALDFRAISDNLATFGPMAHTMGMGIEDVLALFGKLKDQGIEASTAMTSLRNIFTKVSQGKIEGMGKVNSLDDFIAQLNQVKEALGGDTGKAMKMIGPRGGTQFMSLLTAFNKEEWDETEQKNVDSITHLRNRIRQEMEDSSGLDTMSETMNDNVIGAIKKMESAWEGLVLKFGELTGPMSGAITVVTEGIGEMANLVSGKDTDFSKVFDHALDVFNSLPPAIEMLIGTMVAYEASMMGVAAAQKMKNAYTAVELAQYNAMAASMQAVNIDREITVAQMAKQLVASKALTSEEAAEISKDLQSKVSKGQLTEARAREILAMKAQINAIKQKIGEDIAQNQQDLIQNRKLQERLTLKLQNSAADRKAAIAKQLANVKSKEEILLTEGEALAHRQATMAKVGETSATYGLKAAMDALGLSMLTNPYVLAAAAIAGVGVAIYSMATAETSAETAVRTLNDLLNKQHEAVSSLSSQASEYIKTMKEETATVYDKYKAYQDLVAIYKEFGKYTPKEIQLMSTDALNKIISQASERVEGDRLQQMYDIYADMFHTYSTAYSITEDELKKVLKKHGVTDEEEIKGYVDQLNEQSNWNPDSTLYLELMQKLKEEVNNREQGRNEAILSDAINRLGASNENFVNLISTNLEGMSLDKLFFGTSDTLPIGMENLNNQLSESRKRLVELKKELSAVTDESMRAELKVAINMEESKREMIENLLKNPDISKEVMLKVRLNSGNMDYNDELFSVMSPTRTIIDLMGDSAIEANKVFDKVKEKMTDAIAKSRKNIMELQAELRGATKGTDEYNDIKIRLQAEIDAEEYQKEILKALADGKLTQEEYEAIIKIKTETENVDLIGDLDQDSIDKMADAYTGLAESADYYAVKLQEAMRNAKINKTTTDEELAKLGINTDEVFKESLKKVDEARKHVETLREKWMKMKDGVEKNKVKMQLDGAERVLSEVDAVKSKIDGLVLNPHSIQIGLDMNRSWDKDVDSFMGSFWGMLGFSGDKGKKKDLMIDQLNRKKSPEPEPTDPEAQKELSEKEAKKARERRRKIQQADKAFQEAMIKQQEEYEKKRLDMIARADDAEVKAMRDGSEKKRRELELRQDKEFAQFVAYWDNLEAERDAQAAKIWDLNEGKKAARNENYEKKDWTTISDKEKQDFASQNNLVLGFNAEDEVKRENEQILILQRFANEREKLDRDQIKELNDFTKEYGDAEERRLAIVKDYEMQIEDALAGGDYTKARSLGQKMNDDLADFDMKEFKNTLNWDEVFNDLDRRSLESLEKLREELLKALDIKGLGIDDAKVISEQLEKVREAIRSKGNLFTEMFGGVDGFSQIYDKRNRKREAERAREDADYARVGYNQANVAYKSAVTAAQKTLKDAGIDKNVNEVTDADIQKMSPIIRDMFLGQRAEVDRSKAELDKQQKTYNDKKTEAEKKEEAANQSPMDKMNSMMGIAGMVNQNIQSMNHLNESLGLDDTGFGEKVAQFAEVSGSAMNAMQSFMQGDFVGAAASAIDAITGIGKLFGATYGNMEKMNEEIEKLTNKNEVLIAALNDVRDALRESTIFEASDQYDKAVRLFTAAQQNASQIMIDEASKWEKGSHSIKGQLGSDREWLDLMRKAGRELGISMSGSVTDFLKLSADQMKKLRESQPDLFNDIMEKLRSAENKHTGEGLDKMITDYIDQFSDGLEDLETQLYEKFTGLSFDQMFDQFKSTLKDMNSSAADFAKNVEQMFNDIAIDTIADTMKSELKETYKQIGAAMKAQDGKLTAQQRNDFNEEIKDITDRALKMRDEFVEAGKLTREYTDQNFSKGVGSMTEDQADEMNGRMTMIQTTIEQIRNLDVERGDTITSLNGSLSAIEGNTGSISDGVSSIMDQLANSFLELVGIRKNTFDTVTLLSEIRDYMDGVNRNTRNL